MSSLQWIWLQIKLYKAVQAVVNNAGQDQPIEQILILGKRRQVKFYKAHEGMQ